MTQKQLILIELPQDADINAITRAKNISQLDKVCTRLGDTVESDLRRRLYVYEERNGGEWKAEPKIRKIYKCHQKVKTPSQTCASNPRKTKFRTHKKDQE